MSKSTKIILGIVVLFVIGLALVQSEQKKETIKIGVLSILSGDAAAWGQNAKQGIDLAVKEINDKGGVRGNKVELVYEDTGGDGKRAVSAFQKLTSLDRVDGVIGPLFLVEVSAIAPLVKDIPVVTPAASIEIRANPRNPLMIWMDATTETHRMAIYVFDQKIKTVGVFGTKDSWENEVSSAFSSEASNLGMNVISKEIVLSDTSDIRPVITKLVTRKPDAIFLGTYYQFIPAIKILKELGYKGKIYSIEVDQYLVDETKPLSEGLQFIGPDFYVGDFTNRFETEYGQKPGIPAGQAYDAANILLSFFEKYGNYRQRIIQAMKEFKSYDGVSGRIEITQEHRTLFPTAIFEIKDGKIVKVE